VASQYKYLGSYVNEEDDSFAIGAQAFLIMIKIMIHGDAADMVLLAQ
jgi:hypothetical protein